MFVGVLRSVCPADWVVTGIISAVIVLQRACGWLVFFPPTSCRRNPVDALCPATPLTAREEELCNGFQMAAGRGGLCRHIHPPHLLFKSCTSWFLAPRGSRQTQLKDAAGRERAGGFNGEIYGEVLMSERAAAHLGWSSLWSVDTAELSSKKFVLQL